MLSMPNATSANNEVKKYQTNISVLWLRGVYTLMQQQQQQQLYFGDNLEFDHSLNFACASCHYYGQ